MANGGCDCRCSCVFRVLAASAVIGAAAACLRSTVEFAVPAAGLVGILVLAAVYLATVLVVAVLQPQAEAACLSRLVSALLAGILAAVLTAVVLLVIPFAAASIVGAIVTGILASSVSLTLGATACLVRCLTNSAG